jgi:2-oxo-hept-3-ene-1,7-dioate hydratase
MLAASVAMAACPRDSAIEELAEKMLAAEPADPPDVATINDGICAQEKLVAYLEKSWGKPIGYKAGLTSKQAQEMFNVTEPVRGILLEKMMLQNGASVKANYGALPRFEADLVVSVADDDINKAGTPEEVLAHISAVYPFIELPDLVVKSPSELTGPVITAINVGARLGVLGDPIEAVQTEDFFNALANMTVTVTTQDGEQLSSAPGSVVLDHPLNAIVWLRENGVIFEKGDLVSVGSIGPLLPPKPGLTATVKYDGLPGNPEVKVSFE